MSAKNNKILIIVESINPDDSSGSKANVALIDNLSTCGFNIKVLHFTRHDYILETVPCVAIKEQKAHIWYIFSKFQVLIWRLFKLNLNPFFEKSFGFSFGFFSDSFSFKKAIDKENPDDYDWVLTLSKAASFRPHHALLKCPKWHSKWLAYIHDPYPMHFYPRPYNWVAPGYYQQQEFMRSVSKACAYGVFPSKLLQEWMGSYFPDFLERGLVIPHQIIQIISNQELPAIFDINNFTILHAGSINKQRDPTGLVEGFELFLKQHPDARNKSYLYLVGKMNYHYQSLHKKSKNIPQLLLENNYIDFYKVYSMQQAAAVNIVLEAKAEISPFLPGKIPHVMAAEKPILHLGPALSETRRILGEDYTFWSEIDDVNKIATLLSQLYLNWQSKDFKLDYELLKSYMGPEYLKTVFDNLSSNHAVEN